MLQRLRSHKVQRLLSLVISVVCVAAVAWWVLQQDAPTWPDGDHLPWIAAALLADAATYLLRGWRWHHIMHLSAIEHRRDDAVALTIVGYMGNNVLPARGGELLRIGIMHGRATARRRELLGSVVAERVLDAAVLAALFVAMTWVEGANAPVGQLPATLTAGGLVALAIALAAYMAVRRRGRL